MAKGKKEMSKKEDKGLWDKFWGSNYNQLYGRSAADAASIQQLKNQEVQQRHEAARNSYTQNMNYQQQLDIFSYPTKPAPDPTRPPTDSLCSYCDKPKWIERDAPCRFCAGTRLVTIPLREFFDD